MSAHTAFQAGKYFLVILLLATPVQSAQFDSDVVSGVSAAITQGKTLDQTRPAQPAVQAGKPGAPGIPGTSGFVDIYQDVGTLLNKYGKNGVVELSKIQDPAKDRLIGYLQQNKIPTNNIILTENLKIYGTGHSPSQAAADLAQGGPTAKDPWGKKYNVILASDKGGNKVASIFGTMGNNLGLNVYNPELRNHTIIAQKFDVHSQGADVLRQQSGKSLHIWPGK